MPRRKISLRRCSIWSTTQKLWRSLKKFSPRCIKHCARTPRRKRLQPSCRIWRMSDFILICGVDEAGRGPLAGPVSAAAVILDPDYPIAGLADSKKLSERQRDQLAIIIRERALAWAVAYADVVEIDQFN